MSTTDNSAPREVWVEAIEGQEIDEQEFLSRTNRCDCLSLVEQGSERFVLKYWKLSPDCGPEVCLAATDWHLPPRVLSMAWVNRFIVTSGETIYLFDGGCLKWSVRGAGVIYEVLLLSPRSIFLHRELGFEEVSMEGTVLWQHVGDIAASWSVKGDALIVTDLDGFERTLELPEVIPLASLIQKGLGRSFSALWLV